MDLKTLLEVMNRVIPMYVAIILGYIFARRDLVSKEQYEGLRLFVMKVGIPFQTLFIIIKTNLYEADLHVVAAVFIHAGITFGLITIVAIIYYLIERRWNSKPKIPMGAIATYFGVLNYPNAIIVGIPLLSSMYGERVGFILVLLVVVRNASINPILMALYEFSDAYEERHGDLSTEELEHIPDSPRSNGYNRMAQNIELREPSVGIEFNESTITTPNVAVIELENRSQSPPILDNSEHFENPSSGQKLISPTSSLSLRENISDTECNRPMILPKKTRTTQRFGSKMLDIFKNLINNSITRAALLGCVYSLIANAVQKNHQVPEAILESVRIFSNTLAGMAFFNVGYSLKGCFRIPPPGHRLELLQLLVAKFIIAPLLMGLANFLAGLRGINWRIMTLQASLPLAMIPFALAQHHHMHSDSMGLLLTIGTLFALLLIIGYYYWLELYPNFMA